MSSSELSSLSSLPSSDDEDLPINPSKLKQAPLSFAVRRVSTPSSPESTPGREPSPLHENVLADNQSIAFIVMFRSRFAEAFPKNVMNLGPQDIERGVVESVPSEQIENLLCALLGLVLNRKKYVERGHYGRALEEALQTHRSQWSKTWNGTSPLHGGKSFQTMNPSERLELLRTLILWCLNTSEVVTGIVKESYKQSRNDGDLNQPLSVQPWGDDGRRRRYWLIEGQNDTPFRLYRESNPKLIHNTWWSVAGTIDEVKAIGENLAMEKSQAAKRLSTRISSAIPRLEATEEKRKRREYRINRRAQFSRPEPGFSLYEGRTRGKRMKYTFSDAEDSGSDATSGRRSMRQSGVSTPADPGIPTVTASGRQVRSRFGKSYGEPFADSFNGDSGRGSVDWGSDHMSDGSEQPTRSDGRERRFGRQSTQRIVSARPRSRLADYNSADDIEDDERVMSSGQEWDGDDDDVEGAFDEDEDDDIVSEVESEDSLVDQHQSLVVRLLYRKPETAASDFLNSTDPSTPSTERGTKPQTDCSGLEDAVPKINGVASVPTNGLRSYEGSNSTLIQPLPPRQPNSSAGLPWHSQVVTPTPPAPSWYHGQEQRSQPLVQPQPSSHQQAVPESRDAAGLGQQPIREAYHSNPSIISEVGQAPILGRAPQHVAYHDQRNANGPQNGLPPQTWNAETQTQTRNPHSTPTPANT